MKKLKGYLGLVALSVALAACGSKGSSSSDAPAAPAAAPAAADAGAGAGAGAGAAAPATKVAADAVDTIDGTKLADLKGDEAHGSAIFAQCKACHVLDPGVNRIGPSLHGVIGRPAGSIAGFAYSSANKGSGITWSKEKLFQYLEKPQRVVPGTKMTFPGLPKAQDRADVIAYLETASK
jgi:cytochrome c